MRIDLHFMALFASLGVPVLVFVVHTNYLSFCRYYVDKEDIDALDSLLNSTGVLSDVDDGDSRSNRRLD